jgi:hypothetical protein
MSVSAEIGGEALGKLRAAFEGGKLAASRGCSLNA